MFTARLYAAFPPKLNVRFKEKMSCRDAKKLLRPKRLFVSCQTNSLRSIAYSADYFGREPLQKVISGLSANGKVREIALTTDSAEESDAASAAATIPISAASSQEVE
jgi:hypothetical protein